MSTNLTRQQLYDRIRQGSKEEYILSEMKRLGFWSQNDKEPSLPEQLIKKESELQKELQQLLEEKRKYNNKEAMLKEMRQKRMEEAKNKRQITKEKREAGRSEKAARWKQQQATEIIYLGEDVSAGLPYTDSDQALLQQKGLPVFNDVQALATAIGITLNELRFLAYNRKVATTNHYKRFLLPKKSGGTRTISAPMPRLKKTQYWILHHILNKVVIHETAHGFVPQRSILSNANQHVAKEVVVNVDLKDFFPSIIYNRVKGLFKKFGYSEQIAILLALLCTEPDTEEVELDNTTYYVAKGERKLPQGAPTSPAITNILCYKLDCRFTGMAKTLGFTYTRYADDLSFSANKEHVKHVQTLLWRIKRTVEEEGFTVHPDKIHVMRKGSRQEVTGIVVNQQPGINRKTLHRFRSLLHQISKEGFADKKWKGGNILDEIQGYANFVAMVKPALGQKLKSQVREILSNPDRKLEIEQLALLPEITNSESTAKNTSKTTPEEGTDNPWWNVLS